MISLDTPIVTLHEYKIRGIGLKTAHSLAVEAASISAKADARDAIVEDLLHYLPMRYEDRSNLARIDQLRDGMAASVEVVVSLGGIIPFKGGRLKMYEFIATDGTDQIRAFWWNQVYLNKVFHNGTRVIIYGEWKLNRYKGMYEIENPDYEILADDDDEAEINAIHTARRVPVYRKFGDFRTRQLRTIFFRLFEHLDKNIPESLPEDTVERCNLIRRYEGLRYTHFPSDDSSIDDYNQVRSPAHRRLIFEEFFWLAAALNIKRSKRVEESKGAIIKINNAVIETMRSILPFKPTQAQDRALKEILDDMVSSHPMNRLLQGDVGSGKTIVAVQAMIAAMENGYQAALMAPTEILAEQHTRNIKNWLAETKYKIGVLTGSLKVKQKRDMTAAIASGEIDLIVGTHALIQESVEFHKLGLVVIDEQHRFGVMQRAEMRRRGLNPDVLVVTATPIPRSLAMTVYGDLEVSVIDELPPGRTPVSTHVRGEERRDKIYAFIREQIRGGRQAYVVLPLIEESEKLDLRNAKEMYEILKNEIFPEFNVGLLHGKMKPAEKDEVMREFTANNIKILVATTVIEVGVDVPNASVMLIEHAERFGLSQLHQLRGRVGRGASESFCILLTQSTKTKDATERLKTMEQTTDGFKISEKDLEIRGPGEVMGTRQSGIPAFRIANIVRDQKILEVARREANNILNDHKNTQQADSIIRYVLGQPRFGLANVG